jgi:hypothetical protein
MGTEVTNWTPEETTTHQDHVIAHVLGATFLGYFVFDEALYILLDIGFVWTILLNGEMGLLPHPVAVSELAIDEGSKQQIRADIELLLNNNGEITSLMTPTQPLCQIKDVSFLTAGERRRFSITCEDGALAIETSLANREIQVMTLEDEQDQETGNPQTEGKLEEVAESEHDYLHQRLREDLGREPTEAELDEWLRQHTEGY